MNFEFDLMMQFTLDGTHSYVDFRIYTLPDKGVFRQLYLNYALGARGLRNESYSAK